VKPQDQFHVGIVVDDLEAAIAELTAVAGYSWGMPVDVEQQVDLAHGTVAVHFQFRYSVEEPRLEVIQAQPGTIWTSSGSGLHHLGFWSDDLEADGAALEASGYELEAAGGVDARPTWTYHRRPTGPRIELISREIAAMMSVLWTPSTS